MMLFPDHLKLNIKGAAEGSRNFSYTGNYGELRSPLCIDANGGFDPIKLLRSYLGPAMLSELIAGGPPIYIASINEQLHFVMPLEATIIAKETEAKSVPITFNPQYFKLFLNAKRQEMSAYNYWNMEILDPIKCSLISNHHTGFSLLLSNFQCARLYHSLHIVSSQAGLLNEKEVGN